MNRQPDMFEPFPPYQKHSETSFSAASRIAVPAHTLRKRVFDYISACQQGTTDEQIQIALNMNPSTQRPRRVELVDQGWVKDSGRRGKTASGRSAVVWERIW